METCINYCEPGWAYMSTDERRWIKRIRKFSSDHPDTCIIIKEPETNGGFIYCKFPQKWVRVSPPRQIVMDEEKIARLQEMRKKKDIKRE